MEQNRQNLAELEEALLRLRQSLKEREKLKTGRTPQICSDESIREMIRLMPRKPSDFLSIPGVGQAFVENYARDFLLLLADFNGTEEAPVANRSVEETLRELSKKLININRNNRMLFLPRLSPKYAEPQRAEYRSVPRPSPPPPVSNGIKEKAWKEASVGDRSFDVNDFFAAAVERTFRD